MISVYVLKSLKDGGFYTGITKDVQKRLNEHNSGKVHSTKNRSPFEAVYEKKYPDYKSARLREVEIKSYKGGNSFKNLLK